MYLNGGLSFSLALHHVICFALYRIGIFSIEQLHQKIFKKLFRGQIAEPFQNWADVFAQEKWEKLIYAPALKCLQEAKKQGHYTVILSSAPNFLVKFLAERFNVDAWESTHYDIDNTGRFSSISHWMLSESKADYVRKLIKDYGISKQQVTVYSDSIQDLAFLESAGTAIGVNPDRALRKLCKSNQWKIL